MGRAASPRSQKVSARDPLSGVGGSGRPRPYLGSCRTAGAVIKSSGRSASRGSRIVLAARPPRARGHLGWRHRDTVSHPAGHPLRVCWHRWGGQGGLGGSDPQPGSLWGSVALLGTCRVGATAPRPPGHAGEAPTQVLVAPKVKPPPHSHPGGGSGRPCHRCHQAPQADIYPCPGAAWQRASSARCYFRSRSLAAAPSPHCSAPRGAAGGS